MSWVDRLLKRDASKASGPKRVWTGPANSTSLRKTPAGSTVLRSGGQAPVAAKAPTDHEAKKFARKTIDGRYQVFSETRGGMGYVLFCKDLQSGQPVALKLQIEGAGSAELFVEEAKKWIHLGAHPHIVEALYAAPSGPAAYIVLELIPPSASGGCSLRNWLKERCPFEARVVVRWSVQICEAMEYAYSHDRLVHRDLKPENILITPGGSAKITDFGIAGSRMGRGAQGGTPEYMAPEQWSDQTDTRSDIYSVGLVIAEMLLGRLPTQQELTADGFFSAARSIRPTETSALFRDLAGIIAKCCDKEPQRRYQNFADLKAKLGGCAKQRLGIAGTDLVDRSTDSPARYTNQGLALLDLGVRDEGIRMLQKAVAHAPHDRAALVRLKDELETLPASSLPRRLTNQLKENCFSWRHWCAALVLLGLFAIAVAYSPVSSYSKVWTTSIAVFLALESFVEFYSRRAPNWFLLALWCLCLILYAMFWLLVPSEHPPWAQQVSGSLTGLGLGLVPFALYLLRGLGAGSVKLLLTLFVILGGIKALELLVICVIVQFIQTAYVLVATHRHTRNLKRGGIYFVVAGSKDIGMPTTVSIMIAFTITSLYPI
jgi:serine/threonine protein kinase/Flp pilus assembly protein protease CpaA